MIYGIARSLLVGSVYLTFTAYPGAQGAPDPWFGRQAKPQNMDPAKEFTGTFRIELPKNWQLTPGHTGTIFSVVEKTGKWATGGFITLEYMSLPVAFEPGLIAGIREGELDDVQKRELSGKQFSAVVKTSAIGPMVFIQYDRPGVSGTDDHVAQYSIPNGSVMYRLICIAPKAGIESYRPAFAHVAASFTLLKPARS
jgi:hypothetical protein